MTITKNVGFFITASFLMLVFAFSCKKDPGKEVPTVKSAAVNVVVTPTSIVSVSGGGQVITEGSATVSSRGVCWSDSINPTIIRKDRTTVDGKGLGTFKSAVTGLKYGTTYYIRAYATSIDGTGYGEEVKIILPSVLPTLTTLVISTISASTISSGGSITDNGGAEVTERGVCWGNSKAPTTASNVIKNDKSGNGSFACLVAGLTSDSTYYLRAYAINSAGTAYGNERSFATGKSLVKDKDGNFYHFVTIGSQIWMVENLRTTRYRDSTAIPLVDSSPTWSSSVNPGYCWYENDTINKYNYGALYNWYAVTTKKLCPTGWHVPTDAEWTTLTDRLGGEPIAGGKLKEAGIQFWKTPNAAATNESGFSALPGGYRTNIGEFGQVGSYGNWWSTTIAVNPAVAYYRYIYYGNGAVTKSFINQKYGLSVRCLKD